MTTDQIILFSLFGAVFALLLWGRYRYDIVAFSALLIGVVLGVVPTEEAFSGFGHPATIIVALVLVVSAGLVVASARIDVDVLDVHARIAVRVDVGVGALVIRNGRASHDHRQCDPADQKSDETAQPATPSHFCSSLVPARRHFPSTRRMVASMLLVATLSSITSPVSTR